MAANNNRTRLTFDVSAELNEVLERLAEKTSGTKSEVLRKAIALMDVAVDAKGKGQRVGLLDEKDQVVTRIVGL
jgi:predicted transcriptional regulator